jgi:hypothetical protein
MHRLLLLCPQNASPTAAAPVAALQETPYERQKRLAYPCLCRVLLLLQSMAVPAGLQRLGLLLLLAAGW